MQQEHNNADFHRTIQLWTLMSATTITSKFVLMIMTMLGEELLSRSKMQSPDAHAS